MGLSIESARNKIINTYHIDVEKYVSDEIVDEIQKNIENIFSFGIKSLIPSIISGTLLLSASVYWGIRHQSILSGVLCLVCVLPIWLGIWLMNNIFAARSLITGVVFLTNYTINVTRDIVVTINVADEKTVKYSEISLLVLYGIVLPIIKKILRNQLFSGIIYFFVEKLVSMGTRRISSQEDKKADCEAEKTGETIVTEEKIFPGITEKTHDAIFKTSNVVFSVISILGMILSSLCIVTGITLLVIMIAMA